MSLLVIVPAIVWLILSGILIALVFTLILGLVVFKEHLSLIQWLGIILGSIAVVLLLA